MVAMRATTMLAALLLLLGCMSAMAVTLVEPVTVSSTATNWAATFTVEMNRFTNTHMSFTTRQYCYQGTCTFPGPTIRVKPGDTFSLTIVNNLGLEPSRYTHNTFHSPNSTNVHTHGLHIDPNVDSVFIRIPPGGGSHTYVFQIPSNHFPGTHWYHTHMHGNSALQVMGGLYGMMIVDALPAHNIPASITSAPEHHIVIGNLKWNQAKDDTGAITQGCCNGCACNAWQGCADTTTAAPFRPFRAYSYGEIAGEMGDLSSPNPVYHSNPSVTNPLYVNGLYGAELAMVSGTPHYLRILNAGTTYRTELAITPASACSMTAVAADGVYFEAIQTRATLFMFAATRYDIMLKCTATASMVMTYGERDDQWSTTVLSITVSGSSSVALPTDAEMAAIVRPTYLQSLLTTTVTDLNNHNEVHFSQGSRTVEQCGFWLGMGSNCSRVWTGDVQPSPALPTCSFEQMPGNQGGTGYASSPPTGHYKYVTTTGAVNEWRVYGLGNDAHPFHLHVHHFQVVAFQKLPSSSQTYAEYFTIGEWRDTLPALDAKITIRFRAMDFPGQSVLHCHVLRHEDLGMMSSIYICDSSSTGGLPANGCPARNQSAHVYSAAGYNADGTYDVSTGSGTGSTSASTGGGDVMPPTPSGASAPPTPSGASAPPPPPGSGGTPPPPPSGGPSPRPGTGGAGPGNATNSARVSASGSASALWAALVLLLVACLASGSAVL